MIKYKVENIHYKYSREDVIKDISLDFVPNTINVILGLNGSGKTTLIKLLSGILRPRLGIVKIEDKDIHKYTYLERSKYISYVGQGINIGDDYLVEEYLSFGLMNSLKFYQSPSVESIQQVKNAAEKFGIINFLSKKMDELSGGEKQIISICRAFIQNTEIMILDEPTSALDFKNQNLVLSILKEVASVGKTIILSSHNPNHALYLESNVLLIDKGSVIENGLAKDIITKDVLSKVYGNKLKYSKDLDYDEITIG